MEHSGKPEIGTQDMAATPRRGGKGRMALLAVVVALVAGTAGSLGTSALSYAEAPWQAGFMDGPVDLAQIDNHVERMMKHLAVEADATQEQQGKLIAIAQSAVKDLLPLREKVRADHGRAIELFSAASVDRIAIEKLRADHVGLADAATKRIAQALGDAAEVLTPEQRRTLVERISSWHQGFGGWHRG
jgi:Spy/CpxP family protein refolding chaperone